MRIDAFRCASFGALAWAIAVQTLAAPAANAQKTEADKARQRAAIQAAYEVVAELPVLSDEDFAEKLTVWRERAAPAYRDLEFQLRIYPSQSLVAILHSEWLEKNPTNHAGAIFLLGTLDYSSSLAVGVILKYANDAGDDAPRRRSDLKLLSAVDQPMDPDAVGANRPVFGPHDFNLYEYWVRLTYSKEVNVELAEYLYTADPAAAMHFMARLFEARDIDGRNLHHMSRTVSLWRTRQALGFEDGEMSEYVLENLQRAVGDKRWWVRAYVAAMLRDWGALKLGPKGDELRELLKKDNDPVIKRILQ